MKLALADFIGTIAPPTGVPTDPSIFIAGLVRIFILIAALFLLMYLLWGAFDWIISGGDKEKIAKAQSKLTHAIFGMILVFVAIAAFGVVTGNILGIMKYENGSWHFDIPTIKPP